MRPGSVFLRHLLQAGVHNPLDMGESCRSSDACRNSTVLVLPNPFFDAFWDSPTGCPNCIDKCFGCHFFQQACPSNCTLGNFLPGAFGYHYHVFGKLPHWNARANGSVADQLLHSLVDTAKRKLGIAQ